MGVTPAGSHGGPFGSLATGSLLALPMRLPIRFAHVLKMCLHRFDSPEWTLLYFRFAPNSGFWKEEQHEENLSAEQEEKGQVPWLQVPHVHQGWTQGPRCAQEEAAQGALRLGQPYEGNG